MKRRSFGMLLFVVVLGLTAGQDAWAKAGKEQMEEFAQAVGAGDLVAVEQLLEEGVSPETVNEDNEPALLVAVQKANLKLVELLLRKGADPNLKAKSGETAMFALRVGELVMRIPGEWKKIYQALKKAGAKEDLASAAIAGDVGTMKRLIAAGVSPNLKVDGDSVLAMAVVGGNKKAVDYLLEKGAKVGLMEAAAMGDVTAVSRLIQKGEDIHQKGSDGMTLMHVAAFQNHAKVVQHLAKAGLKPDLPLINPKKTKRQKGAAGFTPLLLAGIYNRMAAVNALLELGADPNYVDDSGVPPMFMAVMMGKDEFLKALLAHGGKPNKGEPQNDMTPMHFAAVMGNAEMCQLLLKHGADPASRAKGGLTPMHLAVFGASMPDAQANVFLGSVTKGMPMRRDKDGLGVYIPMDHEGVIRLLLAHGADPAEENEEGMSPLGFARFTGDLDLMDLLTAPVKKRR